MQEIMCQVATPRYFEGPGRVGYFLTSLVLCLGHRSYSCGRCLSMVLYVLWLRGFYLGS
ncbi:unnamed protein product [Laminaria digitata]